MKETKPLQTIEAKAPEGMMIAPKELIEVIGLSHWTLSTHQIWLALLNHSWGAMIDDPNADFEIEISALRGTHDSNDRLADHLLTIQKTVVSAKHGGKVTRVQMLAGTTMSAEDNPRGILRYNWPKNLVRILRNPAQYGKLDLKTVASFTSKYALRLYELAAQRIELHKQTEEIEINHFRELLGVPAGKMALYADFRRFAIEPAVREVNALSPYDVTVEPVKVGLAVKRVRLSWAKKKAFTSAEQAAVKEVNSHRAGRQARQAGTVERVVLSLTPEQIQNGYNAAAKLGARIDKYRIYDDWLHMVSNFDKAPDIPAAHFVEFCKKAALRQTGKTNPLFNR